MIIALVLCVFWQLHTEMDKNVVAVENIIFDYIDGKISDREVKDSFLALKEKREKYREEQRRNSELLGYTIGEIRKNQRARR